jgi:A/G-specific adenine glycosylase
VRGGSGDEPRTQPRPALAALLVGAQGDKRDSHPRATSAFPFGDYEVHPALGEVPGRSVDVAGDCSGVALHWRASIRIGPDRASRFAQPAAGTLDVAMEPPAPRTITDPAVTAVLDWFSGDPRALPWRASRDQYAIWVSEVMSAQTSVARAAGAWSRWMTRWPTVEALAAASLADVLGEWQGLGYPRRARDLHRAAQVVVDRGWPADLTELPGVGPYVAAAIRCFAHEEPVLPLDVNTRRVLARRFPEGIDITGDAWRAGQALMELGQRICTARPACGLCPVHAECPVAEGGSADPAPRARRQARYEGSLRQRRGTLLARVLAEGEVALADADRQAAAELAADGLLRVREGFLRVGE